MQRFGQDRLPHPANGQNALRRFAGGDGLHHVLRHLHRPDGWRKTFQGPSRRGHHGVHRLARPAEGFLHKLRTVTEEEACLPAKAAVCRQLFQLQAKGVFSA
ncbi:hypothetical protein SDC9_171809 [bioreactor metagenome]|uniref:Uncharacterized protein n=1 Tax=bioreactor metagenome TaxID=1076179 RepID=A0A645GBY4_9ZZZZ